jgi:ATP:corrinoid adenosyltransferase
MEQAVNEQHEAAAALGTEPTSNGRHREKAAFRTEMRPIKHPYKAGITAQRGVEF